MAYNVPERIYRTAEGELVPHGHPDAAFLAFPEGTELSDSEADRLGVRRYIEARTSKVGREPQNKMGPQPEDKAGDDLDALRATAHSKGITVDRRWGAERLRQEIAKAPEPQEEQ